MIAYAASGLLAVLVGAGCWALVLVGGQLVARWLHRGEL